MYRVRLLAAKDMVIEWCLKGKRDGDKATPGLSFTPDEKQSGSNLHAEYEKYHIYEKRHGQLGADDRPDGWMHALLETWTRIQVSCPITPIGRRIFKIMQCRHRTSRAAPYMYSAAQIDLPCLAGHVTGHNWEREREHVDSSDVAPFMNANIDEAREREDRI